MLTKLFIKELERELRRIKGLAGVSIVLFILYGARLALGHNFFVRCLNGRYWANSRITIGYISSAMTGTHNAGMALSIISSLLVTLFLVYSLLAFMLRYRVLTTTLSHVRFGDVTQPLVVSKNGVHKCMPSRVLNSRGYSLLLHDTEVLTGSDKHATIDLSRLYNSESNKYIQHAV